MGNGSGKIVRYNIELGALGDEISGLMVAATVGVGGRL